MLSGVMTPADFEKRWKHDVAHAEKTLLKDGLVGPLFIFVGGDGSTSLVPATFSDEATKAKFMDLARLHCVAVDAELVLLRTESWVVVGDELPNGISPARSDRRIETVSVTGSARVGKRVVHRASVREILRGADGRAAGLREVRPARDRQGEEASGPMFNLLPPLRPTAEQRALAGALVEVMKQRLGLAPVPGRR